MDCSLPLSSGNRKALAAEAAASVTAASVDTFMAVCAMHKTSCTASTRVDYDASLPHMST